MGPEVMAGLAIASALTTAAGTAIKAKSDSDAMKAQAAVDQQRVAVQEEWTKRRADEERVAAQSAAAGEMRAARLAQSKLGAVAGASGSGASDETVMKLFGDIGEQGRHNADMAMVAGEQKIAGMTYQSALDRWTTDSNAAIKRAGAKSTALGGYLGATGQALSPMAMRYGGGTPSGGGGATGYGSSYDPSGWKFTSTRYG